MSELNETPRGNRIHIAFFGLRNAGKSTLVNAFTGQQIAIVSDVAGTTTDPVSKAMEILPLGPCLVTDTAGLDDEGELGEMRVQKTLKVLETTDIAVWVAGEGAECKIGNGESWRDRFLSACRKHGVAVIEHRRGEGVGELKKKIAAVKLDEKVPGLLDGLVKDGDRVLCVCPIDESAPKGRLILPQQQVIRECLDKHVAVTVCQPEELGGLFDCSDCSIDGLGERDCRVLVITDSQAFGKVNELVSRWNGTVEQSNNLSNRTIRLTSFSILFARQKGDLLEYVKGLKAIKDLKDGDTVLVAEGCTHHRQCNDIGSVKIPKALQKLSGRQLKFEFASGMSFPIEHSNIRAAERFSLVVHCGGCMLTRREMLRRIGMAKEAGVPIVNYGLVLAEAAGVPTEGLVSSVLSPQGGVCK